MKKWDIIIIVILIVISFLPEGVFWIVSGRKNYSGTYAEITVNSKLYKRINLSDHKGTEKLTIKTKYGENVVEIQDNKISIIEADCPDKVCERPGFIEEPGDTLVCLPHRLIIEIKGNKEENDEILSY